MHVFQFLDSFKFNYNFIFTDKVWNELCFEFNSSIFCMQRSFPFERYSNSPKFLFQRILIDLLRETTTEKPMHCHSSTDYSMCLFFVLKTIHLKSVKSK